MKRHTGLFLIGAVVLCFAGSVRAQGYFAYLTSEQEVPANASSGRGYARIFVDESDLTISYTIVFNGLAGQQNGAHIHAPAPIGANAGISIAFPNVGGTSGVITGSASITPTQISQIRQHLGYVNVHSTAFPGGEIRGQLGIKRPVDFDGDGRQDFSVMRFPNTVGPRPITFWNQNSTTGVQVVGAWGDANTDIPVPGDYDGDGTDDFALYRDGTPGTPQSEFWILKNSTFTVQYYAWGLDADIPIARDYDGDGITDVATFRRGAAVGDPAVWYIRQSTDGTARVVHWGTTGATPNDQDFPVPGDYDGDGRFDLAIYRASTSSPVNSFFVLRSSDGMMVVQPFGNFNPDTIVPGDYDGDGKFDYAVARIGISSVAPLTWWILQSSDGQVRVQRLGVSSNIPVQGDYDGDAVTDLAVYSPAIPDTLPSTFRVLRSFDNTIQVTEWGLREDLPVAGFDAR